MKRNRIWHGVKFFSMEKILSFIARKEAFLAISKQLVLGKSLFWKIWCFLFPLGNQRNFKNIFNARIFYILFKFLLAMITLIIKLNEYSRNCLIISVFFINKMKNITANSPKITLIYTQYSIILDSDQKTWIEIEIEFIDAICIF